MNSKYAKLRNAIKAYIASAEMIPSKESMVYWSTGEYRRVSLSKPFTDPAGNVFQLMAPDEDWQTLAASIQEIFGDQLVISTVEKRISAELRNLKQWPLPSSTLRRYVKKTAEYCLYMAQNQWTVYVPIGHSFSLLPSAPDKIAMANGILHFKGAGNAIKNIVPERNIESFQQEIDAFGSNTGFIEVKVLGDEAKILDEALIEAEKILALFRFVTHWTWKQEGRQRVRKNAALNIGILNDGVHRVFYIGASQFGFKSKLQLTPMNIAKEWLDTAKEYGLDHINYHYQNSENLISRRILDALEFYDSGVTATSDWQAMYRYVASVNIVLLGGSKKQNLQLRLAKLIKAGDRFTGIIDLFTTWEDLVKEKTAPFDRFYMARSDILHSMDGDFSIEDVHNARQLAFNAIRAMAYIARRENFQTKEEALNWIDKVSL